MTQEYIPPWQDDDKQQQTPQGSEPQRPARRKPYEKPAILYSEALEALASACDGGKTSELPQSLLCRMWTNS